MHTSHAIYEQLVRTLGDIDQQMTVLAEKYQNRVERVQIRGDLTEETVMDDLDIYSQVDRNGRPVMLDLLVSRGQILSAMAALKAADVTSKAAKARNS